MKLFKLIVVSLGVSTAAFFATGCNTIGGAGEDIEGAGEAIQRKAANF